MQSGPEESATVSQYGWRGDKEKRQSEDGRYTLVGMASLRMTSYACASSMVGNRSVKVVPTPSVLWKVNDPPNCPAMRCEI